jgi:hypothetical protein
VDLNYLYTPHGIVKAVKSKWLHRAGNEVKPLGIWSLQRTRKRWEGNITMDLREVGCEDEKGWNKFRSCSMVHCNTEPLASSTIILVY